MTNQPAVIAEPDPSESRRAENLFRVVQIGLLLSLGWKYKFFWGSWVVLGAIRIDDPFFPTMLSSEAVGMGLFVATAVAIVASICQPRGRVAIVSSLTTCVTTAALCVHQVAYNDATFTTMWWTSLWATWFACAMRTIDGPSPWVFDRAARLSRLIISMIMLGGAVGKWTAEYWDGSVLYDIYFVDRDFWVFNALRSQFGGDTLRSAATAYSRMVVVTETVVGLSLWAMPPRVAAVIAMLLLSSIAMFSNFLLFSVMACLIGLGSAGMFVRRSPG